MKLKKITAAFLAVLLCICAMSVGVSAAKNDSISLNKASASVAVGKSVTLKATASDGSSVTWSTSDKTVAAVSKKGVVTGKKIGTATITAKLKGTKKTASCTVKVVRGNKISADLTGQELVDKINAGINYSCLEPCDCPWLENELDYENSWVYSERDDAFCAGLKTTPKCFTSIKKAGFNAVRIPVSWTDHMDKDGNISKVWLDRVQEVVNYAYDNGLYVILNTHHEDKWLSMSKYDSVTTEKFKNVWTQIADRFKNYDERLLFEGMNEPRTVGTENEWTGGTADERKNLNRYNKLFVDTVRKAGGNNANRCLIITSYCGTTAESALTELEIPNNDNKVIVAVHAYVPWGLSLAMDYEETKFDSNAKSMTDNTMWEINEFLVKRGIPVILGEFGTGNKNNTSERAAHAKYTVSEAKKLGVPCFWWDSGTSALPNEKISCNTGIIDRKTYEWIFPEIVEALTGKKVK